MKKARIASGGGTKNVGDPMMLGRGASSSKLPACHRPAQHPGSHAGFIRYSTAPAYVSAIHGAAASISASLAFVSSGAPAGSQEMRPQGGVFLEKLSILAQPPGGATPVAGPFGAGPATQQRPRDR